MQKRFVLIAGIIFLAGACLFGFLAVRNYFLFQPAVHLLAATQKQIYVGDVFQGHTEGEAWVYNHSDKPVTISDVITNCRCSEVSVSREPILPGEKTTVKCRWDTTGLRGDTSSEFLLLFYKEGETKLYSLPMIVRGNILPKFDIVPDKLEFLKKSPQLQKLKLVARQNEKINIKEAYCTSPVYKVEWKDDEVSVSYVGAGKEFDSLRADVEIHTDFAGDPVVKVPVHLIP